MELDFGMRFSVAYLKHEMASNSAAATTHAIQLAYRHRSHRCHRTRQLLTAGYSCRLAWRSGVDRPGMSRSTLGCDDSGSLDCL